MNDCLFEPSYSTFTISLLARPRCPTGRVIRIYSVHFQSQLYLSQSFVSGAAGLEPAMCLSLLVLETSAVASVPRTYYQRREWESNPQPLVLQTSPLAIRVSRQVFTVGWRIELQLRSSRRTIFKIATHANQVFPTIIKFYKVLSICLLSTSKIIQQVKGFEPSTSDLEGRSSTR